jgi:hypothetical protein
MMPQSPKELIKGTQELGVMRNIGRVTSGFYISQAMEFST